MTRRKKGTSNGHGGKRPGAGRKNTKIPLVAYSVDITHAQAELLKQWGGGNISAGLRWLIDVAELWIRNETTGEGITPAPVVSSKPGSNP